MGKHTYEITDAGYRIYCGDKVIIDSVKCIVVLPPWQDCPVCGVNVKELNPEERETSQTARKRILEYQGKSIEDLSREELIEAVGFLFEYQHIATVKELEKTKAELKRIKQRIGGFCYG